jgi:hypothetical protein
MRLRLTCPTCKAFSNDVDVTSEKGTVNCSEGHNIVYSLTPSIKNEGVWDQCPRCGSFDAYVQKDVPKKLFLISLVVMLGVAFYLLSVDWIMGMGFLLSLTLLDLVLYRTLPDLLVCYGCKSQARGFVPAEHLKPHDHHIAENYRQSRMNLL